MCQINLCPTTGIIKVLILVATPHIWINFCCEISYGISLAFKFKWNHSMKIGLNHANKIWRFPILPVLVCCELLQDDLWFVEALEGAQWRLGHQGRAVKSKQFKWSSFIHHHHHHHHHHHRHHQPHWVYYKTKASPNFIHSLPWAAYTFHITPTKLPISSRDLALCVTCLLPSVGCYSFTKTVHLLLFFVGCRVLPMSTFFF